MKIPAHLFSVGLALAVIVAWPATVQANVLSPTARQNKLNAAKKVLSPGEASLPANLLSPFNPAGFAGLGARGGANLPPSGGEETPVPAVPRGDQAVLQAIATGLKPSGFFVIGGESTLVFGQKKVKAGSFLTIAFEGASYTLEITAIDRSTFTLRFNREEYTRPIK